MRGLDLDPEEGDTEAMAIPPINASHVLAAIEEIDRDGVPPDRQSRKYLIEFQGRHYPPKYVISLAVRHATGRELHPEVFSGGLESNSLLTGLGFSIVAKKGFASPALTPVEKKGTPEMPSSESTRTADPIQPESVLIARVVVDFSVYTPKESEETLLFALEDWPEGLHAKFLVTPGGFVQWEFPASWRGGCGWESTEEDFRQLCNVAEKALEHVLTEPVKRALRDKVDVLTVGVDLSNGDDGSLHAELVAAYDVKANQVHWTGKSYPTMSQDATLVQVVDLKSHLQELAGERVLVLGCHDLNVFSPRTHKNLSDGSVRWQRCNDMVDLAREFNPTIVLQHPHTTDTPRIWSTAWSGVRKMFPELKSWASGIAYVNWDGEPRGDLDAVLNATQGGEMTEDICLTQEYDSDASESAEIVG